MGARDYRSIYVFLFLQIAFFFFQVQDRDRFADAFHLSRETLFSGEIWRLLSFQFVTPPFFGSEAIGLFLVLLLLYIFGSAIEENYGTAAFVSIFAISTLVAAGTGLFLGVPLLGGIFVGYSLLFIYAHMFPDHQFYLLFIIPIKVKWIALFALLVLAAGLLARNPSSIAAAAGAAAAFAFYTTSLRRERVIRPRPPRFEPAAGVRESGGSDPVANANLEVFRRGRAMVESGDQEGVEELISRLEPNIVPGVNICPPVDYKPEGDDRYCIRCEGFKECTVRYLRTEMSETAGEPAETVDPSGIQEVGTRN